MNKLPKHSSPRSRRVPPKGWILPTLPALPASSLAALIPSWIRRWMNCRRPLQALRKNCSRAFAERLRSPTPNSPIKNTGNSLAARGGKLWPERAGTVDTIPPATFDAFRDHGRLRNSLTEDVPGAAKTMENLAKAGISMKEVTDKLILDGVKLFADAFRQLLDATGKSAGARP